MVDFCTNKADAILLTKIIARFKEFKRRMKLRAEFDAMELAMDLSAAHLNGCPLDLAKLLAFDDANFGHDVLGIRRYIDRNNGKLTDCFVPRCAS